MLKQAFTEQLELPAAAAARETDNPIPTARSTISLEQILIGVMSYAIPF